MFVLYAACGKNGIEQEHRQFLLWEWATGFLPWCDSAWNLLQWWQNVPDTYFLLLWHAAPSLGAQLSHATCQCTQVRTSQQSSRGFHELHASWWGGKWINLSTVLYLRRFMCCSMRCSDTICLYLKHASKFCVLRLSTCSNAQVNYFPSRFDPVRHSERVPISQSRLSGVREKVIRCPGNWAFLDFLKYLKFGGCLEFEHFWCFCGIVVYID